MAAKQNNSPVNAAALSFAQKRALLKTVAPAPVEASGLRTASIALIGGSVSGVRSYWDDIKTEYQFAEAQRKAQL